MSKLDNANIVHIIKERVEYIQCKRLLQYQDMLKHAYTIRKYEMDFNRNNLTAEEMENNYKIICHSLDINYKNIVRPKQSHTDIIECVYDKDGLYTDVDGLCTNKSDIILSLVYADCMPLLFYDPIKNVISNVHSGWKGTIQRISVNAIEKMKEEYGSKFKDIICFIGPSICKKHFSVHKDVRDIFFNEFKKDIIINDIIEEANIEEGKQKYEIDTVKINRILMEKKGLLPQNIIESNLCTVCNKEYFHSYRAESETSGRNTAIITLLD